MDGSKRQLRAIVALELLILAAVALVGVGVGSLSDREPALPRERVTQATVPRPQTTTGLTHPTPTTVPYTLLRGVSGELAHLEGTCGHGFTLTVHVDVDGAATIGGTCK